jgi:hypothetical protein
MSVDTLRSGFHNSNRGEETVKDVQAAPDETLESAVSSALRDNLAPLQRTADELQQAYADLVAACSSSKPANALPAMLRAQAAASSLAAGLSVLSNFVAVALNPPDRRIAVPQAASTATVAVEADRAEIEHESEWAEETPELSAEPEDIPVPSAPEIAAADELPLVAEPFHSSAQPEAHIEIPIAEPMVAEPVAAQPEFDVTSFPPEIQDLHRRANRVAKVAMQDIKLLRPQDVQLGREQHDICERLRGEIDKARKEYDRRFRAIQDHPVDYFHRWMVEILAGGDVEALGEYPYPSPVLHH